MKQLVMHKHHKTLQLLRMASLLAAFLYIVFGFFMEHVLGVEDLIPWSHRALFSVFFSSLAGLSYISSLVRKHMPLLAYALGCAAVLDLLVMGAQGQFYAGSVVGLLLVIPIMNSLFYRWKFLLYANAGLLALIMGVFAVSSPTYVEGLLFLIASAAINGISFWFTRRLLWTEVQSATNEQMFQDLFRHSMEGIAIHELIEDDNGVPVDYVFVDVNPTFQDYTGLQGTEILGKRVTEVLPGIENSGIIEKYGAVVRTGESIRFEEFSEALQRWYRVSAYPMGGNRFVTAFEDVTERRKTEQQLARATQEYETVFQSTQDAMFLIEVADQENFRFIRNNPAHALSTGLKSSEMEGKTPAELVGEELGAVIHAHYKRCVQTGQPIHYEETLALPGGIRTWSTVLTPVMEAEQVSYIVGSSRDITDRKKGERELQTTNAVLDSIIENIPSIMLFLKDADELKFVRYNRAAEELLGVSRSELYGKTDYEFFPKEQADFFTDTDRNVLRGEFIDIPEEPIQTKKGDRILHTIKVPILNDEGEPKFLLGISEDITERKKMEAAQKKREQYLSSILQTTQDGFWMIDDQERIVEVNEAYCRMSGYTKDELLVMAIPDLEALAMPEETNARVQRILKNGAELFETRHRKKDGTLWDVEVSVTRLELDNDVVMICFCRDVTERKQVENDLREAKSRLETVSDNMLDLVSTTDLEGNYKFAGASHRLLGYDVSELIGTNVMDRVHPDDLPSVQAVFDTFLTNRQSKAQAEYRYRCADGSYIWFETFGSFLFDEVGEPVEILFNTRDITQRKQDREALQSERQHFIDLMEDSLAGYWDWDLVGNAEYLSPGFKRMFGYEDHELENSPETWQALIYPDDLAIVLERFESHVQSKGREPYYSEVRYRHKDETTVWVICAGRVVEWDGDRPLRMIGCHIDITERKQAEEALQLSESRYRSVIAVSNTGAWEYHSKEKYLWCSPEYFAMLGYDPDDFLMDGSSNLDDVWVSLLHPDDRSAAGRYFADCLAAESSGMYSNYFRMRHKGGGWVWIWSRGKTIAHPDGSLTNLTIGTHINVTDRIEMEQQLSEEKEQFKTTLLSVGDGVISTDAAGKVLILNSVAEQLTGWTQKEAVGQSVETVFNIINEFTRNRCDNPVAEVLATGKVVELANHTLLISRDGLERPIEDSAAPIRDKDGNVTGVVLVFRDFTDKKIALDQIAYLSFHDGLTGLYNRRFFDEELKRLDVPRNQPLSVMMLDVNGLKLTNDAFGHPAGDELLTKVAAVLRKACRADDIVARIGGDEFVVLLPQTNNRQARQMTERIRKAIASEKVGNLPISVSCGLAAKTEQWERITDVFKTAEDHMYRHKISEQNSYRHQTIQLIMQTLYAKSPREQQHFERVSEWCGQIGSAMDLDVSELTTAGMLHDIGKVAISESILDKIPPLSDGEWTEIRRHPEAGYSILSSVNDYGPLADSVLAHHERWDGKGYPTGLKGTDIPKTARVIAVADAYDAMTSDRPYRQAMSHEEAIAEMAACAGSQFDPEIVKVFVEMLNSSEFAFEKDA